MPPMRPSREEAAGPSVVLGMLPLAPPGHVTPMQPLAGLSAVLFSSSPLGMAARFCLHAIHTCMLSRLPAGLCFRYVHQGFIDVLHPCLEAVCWSLQSGQAQCVRQWRQISAASGRCRSCKPDGNAEGAQSPICPANHPRKERCSVPVSLASLAVLLRPILQQALRLGFLEEIDMHASVFASALLN